MTALEEKISVYSTENGRKTLLNLLEDLGTFRQVTTPGEVALRNEGIKIMDELGMLEKDVLKQMLDVFFSMDLRKMLKERDTARNTALKEYFGGLIPPGR